MSVDLIIWNRLTNEPLPSLSVGNQLSIMNYWIPAANFLELVWIPYYFISGAQVQRENIPTVIAEFKQIQSALRTKPPAYIPTHKIDQMLNDIPWLIDALENAPEGPEIEICFA